MKCRKGVKRRHCLHCCTGWVHRLRCLTRWLQSAHCQHRCRAGSQKSDIYWMELAGWEHGFMPSFNIKPIPGTRQEHSEYHKSFFHPRKEVYRLYIGSISASPTAFPSRGYGRAGTQNDRLGEAVILSTGTPIPARWACRRRCRYRADIEL